MPNLSQPASRKALIVSEYGALNGGEFSFLTALPKLQRAGFQFSAALPSDSGFADLLRGKNVSVIDFRFHDDDGTRKPQDQIREELGRLIETREPDIVHANSLAASRILGPVSAQSSVIGLGYLRDIIKLSRKAIDDVAMLDCIVAVSQATADFHAQRGMPAEKILVIHNGVDLERFRPARATRGSRQVVLCIGQIGIRKGLDLSLEMLASVFQQVSHAELWVVGQRHSQKAEAIEYEQQLKRFAAENFGGDRVKWLGRRSDIPDLMRQATLLVHGAKQEPLGRVLLEAAASGLPIVTTNVGGTPEILEGAEELMFPPSEFQNAATVAQRLLTDAEYHCDVSERLRLIAERKFAAKRSGEELAETYIELCQSRGR